MLASTGETRAHIILSKKRNYQLYSERLTLKDHASLPKKSGRTRGWEPTTDPYDNNADLQTENRALPILADRDKPSARVVCQPPNYKKEK